MKKRKTEIRRSCFVGFFMTLLLCSALVLAGIAWNNTASAIYGDVALIDVKPIPDDNPQISVQLTDKVIIVDLSELNTAAKYLQEYYPAIPYPIRMVTGFFSGIRSITNELADYLF